MIKFLPSTVFGCVKTFRAMAYAAVSYCQQPLVSRVIGIIKYFFTTIVGSSLAQPWRQPKHLDYGRCYDDTGTRRFLCPQAPSRSNRGRTRGGHQLSPTSVTRPLCPPANIESPSFIILYYQDWGSANTGSCCLVQGWGESGIGSNDDITDASATRVSVMR